MTRDPSAWLKVCRLEAWYGDFQALFGIDFYLGEGEIVAIIGANGAGKSTLLRTIAGQLPAAPEAVMFRGEPFGGKSAHQIVRQGIALIPEGRRLFTSLSVEENLQMGLHSRRSGPWTLERVYRLFPVLETCRKRSAGVLSGGQQQMVAVGRALMSNPIVLLCDEISLGLAPTVINDIYAAIPEILDSGCSIVLVEQDISRALLAADRVYCLLEGKVSLEGLPADLRRERIAEAYFGI
jgi:branched-chain amino acid transport system ATP-binding protein